MTQPPAKSGERDLCDQIRGFMNLGAMALQTWVERLGRSQSILASEAQYDPQTQQPLNEAARLHFLIKMTIEEHLSWAVTTLRAGQDSAPEPTRVSKAVSGVASLGLPGALQLGHSLPPEEQSSKMEPAILQPVNSPEARVLATLLRIAPNTARTQLRTIFETRTTAEQRVEHLLDSGVAAMGYWMADLEEAAEALPSPEDSDSETHLAKHIFDLCFDHLHPALLAAQSTLKLARSSDAPHGRDDDEGILPVC